MLRRTVLKLGLAQAALATLPKSLAATEETIRPDLRITPSVLQGATDSFRTQFSVLYDRSVELSFVAVDEFNNQILPDSVDVVARGAHPLQLSKPYFSNLKPERQYQLQILNSKSAELIESRVFRTLDSTGDDVKFAVCSCMKDSNHEPNIWRDLVAQKPDIILFIGDAVYADSGLIGPANPEQLWQRYCEARQTLEIFFSPILIPILATWDDHDFGQNDTGDRYPYIKESRENFQNFYAQNEGYCEFLKSGPGVSSCFKLRSQVFMLMDSRTFRKTGGYQDRFGHWGQEQEQWLLSELKSEKQFAWLANGSQFFPEFPWKEGVARNHPLNLKGLVKELRTKKTKVAFLSGDVHFSELMKIEPQQLGYETLEVTSSPVHSNPGHPIVILNSRRVRSANVHNYVLITSRMSDKAMSSSIVSRTGKAEVKFSYNFEVLL